MKQYVSVYDFRDRFLSSDTYKGNFTYEGLTALFEYLEDLDQSTGEELYFDYIAIACEYSEYESAWEAMEQYNAGDMPVVDFQAYSDAHDGEGMNLVEMEKEMQKLALEWLEERTQVIPVGDTGRVIIQEF